MLRLKQIVIGCCSIVALVIVIAAATPVLNRGFSLPTNGPCTPPGNDSVSICNNNGVFTVYGITGKGTPYPPKSLLGVLTCGPVSIVQNGEVATQTRQSCVFQVTEVQ